MQLIWPGLWCKRLCLLGGLQFLVSDLKGLINGTKPAIGKRDMGRRIFIGSAVGAAAAIAIPFLVNGAEEGSKINKDEAQKELELMTTRFNEAQTSKEKIEATQNLRKARARVQASSL